MSIPGNPGRNFSCIFTDLDGNIVKAELITLTRRYFCLIFSFRSALFCTEKTVVFSDNLCLLTCTELHR